MDPAISQYVIGADVPPLRAPRGKRLLYRFVLLFVVYSAGIWLIEPRSRYDTLPGVAVRGLIFALVMTLFGLSPSEGTESLLVVTEDYVERKYLSSAGTTIKSRKILRHQIKSVSEVSRRFRPFPFRRRKGLMIKERMLSFWLGESIFVPETAPDYAAIKAKLSDWVAPKCLA